MGLDGLSILKLLAAVAAGAVIGFEREVAGKSAGFRTLIMICLGAALFTELSLQLGGNGDGSRARVAAQVVTGVGFLGAGAIIQQRNRIIGLTTAATIWAVASVGMAFGAGEFGLGLLATALVTGVLFGLDAVETWIGKRFSAVWWELELTGTPGSEHALRDIIHQIGIRLESYAIGKQQDLWTIRLQVEGSQQDHEQFERWLLAQPTVVRMNRS